jgi:hypothetical protein
VRFSTRDWRDNVHQAAKDFKFQATLKPRLDRAIEDWHEAQPQTTDPVVVNEPIDDELQTGESRLLGGGMSIHAPWTQDSDRV